MENLGDVSCVTLTARRYRLRWNWQSNIQANARKIWEVQRPIRRFVVDCAADWQQETRGHCFLRSRWSFVFDRWQNDQLIDALLSPHPNLGSPDRQKIPRTFSPRWSAATDGSELQSYSGIVSARLKVASPTTTDQRLTTGPVTYALTSPFSTAPAKSANSSRRLPGLVA
jgi:hypothetical protein